MGTDLIPTISVWILLAVGVLLIGLEIFMTIFVMLFFGLAFILVGGLTYYWQASGEVQLLLVLLLGGLLLFVLRKPILNNMNHAEEVKLETFETGETGKIVEYDNSFRVEYHGTTWAIKNSHDLMLEAGQIVKVIEIKNNQAVVETL